MFSSPQRKLGGVYGISGLCGHGPRFSLGRRGPFRGLPRPSASLRMGFCLSPASGAQWDVASPADGSLAARPGMTVGPARLDWNF